jgi:hypothetical protein
VTQSTQGRLPTLELQIKLAILKALILTGGTYVWSSSTAVTSKLPG